MADQKQTIVSPAASPTAAKGKRDDTSLKSIFPASPVYTGEMTDAERTESYQFLSLDGDIVDDVIVAGVNVPGGAGNGLNNHNRDFVDAPDLESVDIAGHNLPSPFMPNPTSPGPGSLNAADKPAFTGTVPQPGLNVEFGAGLPGTTSPKTTSTQISGQSLVLGAYISGRSYAGSDGAP